MKQPLGDLSLQLFAIFLSNRALKSVRNDKPIALTTWGIRSAEDCAQGGGRDGRNTENDADPWRDGQIIFREIRQKRRGEVEPRPMSFRRNRLLWNCVVKARSPRFSASIRAGQRHFLAWHRWFSVFLWNTNFSSFFLIKKFDNWLITNFMLSIKRYHYFYDNLI